MQRSWLQWVAAGDQWYLNKLGMECCLIYQGEPSLTWVGMPGDISFPWVLNCCGQQDTNSWDSWITRLIHKAGVGIWNCLHMADSAAEHNCSYRFCTVTRACTWQNCICWWDMRVPVTSSSGPLFFAGGNKGKKRMSIEEILSAPWLWKCYSQVLPSFCFPPILGDESWVGVWLLARVNPPQTGTFIDTQRDLLSLGFSLSQRDMRVVCKWEAPIKKCPVNKKGISKGAEAMPSIEVWKISFLLECKD